MLAQSITTTTAARKALMINRWACRCKLCKARWMTDEPDRTKAFDAHENDCPKYTRWLASRTRKPEHEKAERHQMSSLYFEHLQLEGRYRADKVCDGRCMGATGHKCECSCGGKNHGIGSLAV